MKDSNPRSGPVEGQISDLVAIQSGTVVSKEILKKEGGTVTLFAFDEGQGLSEHSAPFDALVLVLEGTAWIHIAGEKHVVRSGEVLVMPADIPHALDAPEPFKMMLVMIKSR